MRLHNFFASLINIHAFMGEYIYTLEFFPGITRETIDRFMDDLVEELESQGIVAGGSYNTTCAKLAMTSESQRTRVAETIRRTIMAVNDRYHCVTQWSEGVIDD